MTGACLSSIWISKQPNMLSTQSNQDVPSASEHIQKIQTSEQRHRRINLPSKNSFQSTGESRDTATQQEAYCPNDPSLFTILKESNVFLLYLHTPPPLHQLSPLRRKTTKTNEFGLLKRSVKHLPPVSGGATEVSVFPVHPLQRH